MDAPQPEIALIVGAGSGLSASLARLFAREGMAVGLAARNPDKLAASMRRDRRACLRLRRHRPRRRSSACSPTVESDIGVPDVVVYNAAARASGPFVDLAAGAGPVRIGRRRVRRLPGCPAGRPADAAARTWRGAVHRRIGERQGLPAIGAVRDGQVCAARAGPEHGARARPAGHPRRPFRHRRRDPQSGP